MQRFSAIFLSSLLLVGILLGCTQPNQNKNDDDDQQVAVIPNVKVNPVNSGNGGQQPKIVDAPKNEGADTEAEKEQKFNDALGQALTAVAERKWTDALAAFEAARAIQDTEFIRSEIARLKERIDQDGSAKNTVKNIETVINEGKADEAVELVNSALKVFGDGDDADKLVQLRLQADALQAVQSNENKDARYKRFRAEGRAAVKEKNLRAAALAFEQALQAQEDAELQTSYEEIRAALDKYDSLRKKAAELRRDPVLLDDALESLKQAKEAWDTVQVRNETDEVLLALQKRRDTVSVADFEVRNDVGAADAGAALADEILPRLKGKYNLVERTQLKRVLGELKLETGFGDDAQQQQLGQLAKVRYLVVGSIRQIGGITVQARLVDVRTGLIVQTAKIVAPTIEDALNQAPDLAKQLLMTDDEKANYDQEIQERLAKKVDVVAADAVVDPAPLPPAPEEVEAPRMPILNAAPPLIDDFEPKGLDNLPPPPEQVIAPPADLPPPQVRQRVLFAALEMGDHHFRARRFHEAQRHFEFALNLAPGNFDIRLRLERVRPLLPPPPVVIVQQPVFVARPRLAVLPFATVGKIPRSLGQWTPTNLAPYFSSRYDVVDPAEIYWFMGRMGMSMRDLMEDPAKRRWLGRAVGVRYFVLGSHVETLSFDVKTYLVDAEFGHLVGSAQINVRDRNELKFRLPELATITMMNPAERTVYFEGQRRQRFDQFVINGRKHFAERNYARAVADFEEALSLRPNVVIVQIDLMNAREALRLARIQELRRQQYEAQLAEQAAQRALQLRLAQEAEAARRRAIADAAARSEAERRIHVNLRFQAQNNMVTQAQVALKTKNFGISVSLFQGAMGMAPPPVVGAPVPLPPTQAVFQDFAQARLEAERAARFREAKLAADREAALQLQRQRDLLAAQQAYAAEQQRQKAAQDAARQAALDRDNRAFAGAIAQGQGLIAQSKFEAALVAFQGAQRVAHGPKQLKEVNQYLEIVIQRQTEALAKSETEKKEIERKLLIERERRRAAEAQAKHNEELYKLAMQFAQKALNEKNYDAAQTEFEKAGKLYRTDVVLAGLRHVQEGRASLQIEQKKAAAETKKAERIKQLIADGNAALDAKKYTDAVLAFQQAKKLAPTDLGVMTGLTRAEQLRNLLETEAQRKAEETARTQNFQRLLKTGQENLKNKQYEAALATLGEAVKLSPTDPVALAAHKQAKLGYDAANIDAKAKAAAQERAAAYQKHINAGQFALTTKRYDDAIKAFGAAQMVLPGDKASKDYLQEAQNAKKAAEDLIASAAKQRADEMKKAADLKKALTLGQAALAAKDLAAAGKLLNQAKALNPNDAEVQRSLKDLDLALQRQAAESAALKKRDADFKNYVDLGKAALAKKQYPEALKALSSATTLIPTNKEAQDLFRRAQNEQRQAEDAAAKSKITELITTGLAALKAKNYDVAEKALRSASIVDPTNAAIAQGLKDVEAGRKVVFEAKQKQAGYELAMSAGDKAFKAKNYEAAIKSFQQALQWMPNDPQGAKRLLQAQVTQAQTALEAKTQANFKLAMDAGEKSLKLKMYPEAINSFNAALKLMPNDLRAKTLLTQAQQALAGAGLEAKTRANFKLAMDAGEQAFKTGNYADAVKAFTEAVKLMPTDQRARLLLQQAQQSLTAAAQVQQNYAKALTAGQSYLKTMKYPEAIVSFNEALKFIPKDAQALQGLQAAQKALDASKTKTPPPNPFDLAMQRGAALEKEQKFGEAMKAFQDALKLQPKDQAALVGMTRNQYFNHVVVGQKYLEGGMFIEAQREFESALQIQPADKNVQALLDKAKKKMKK